MSQNQQQNEAPARPQHTHYVSRHNGATYPAMKNPPAFEDNNPNDWRPANAAEIEAYKNGSKVEAKIDQTPVVLSAPATPAAPAAIVLAPEEPAAATTDDPPLLPPGALPTGPAFPIG